MYQVGKKTINVNGQSISVILDKGKDGYICLTDMARTKSGDSYISDWIRNTDTIDYLGAWESLYNPDFNYGEFTTIRNESGGRAYRISVKDWIKRTNAIGIKSTPGRYGGTYAHKDIAFNFGMWLSPPFQLYVVKEYQRLVEVENSALALEWDVNRLITKANYLLHTEAIKNFVVPTPGISARKAAILYATEADVLNLSVFGYTAKQWEESNPELSKRHNMRDTATINELIVLSNIESMNAELIKRGIHERRQRFAILHRMAKEQLRSLNALHKDYNFRRLRAQNDNKELDG